VNDSSGGGSIKFLSDYSDIPHIEPIRVHPRPVLLFPSACEPISGLFSACGWPKV